MVDQIHQLSPSLRNGRSAIDCRLAIDLNWGPDSGTTRSVAGLRFVWRERKKQKLLLNADYRPLIMGVTCHASPY